MSVLSAKERGDMVEELLPVAAHLVTLVHGDGGAPDVYQVLAQVDARQKDALLVVLAGLVDPDQSMGAALGWLDFDENGELAVPNWEDRTRLRDLVPEPVLEDEETYVDPAAVHNYLVGRRGEVTPRERLAAIVAGVRRGMTYPDFDRMHRLTKGATSTFISRTRRAFQERGEEFPQLERPSVNRFTEEQVRDIRQRSAAGATDMEIGISYGVDQKAIGHICRGRRYPQYGGPIRAAKSSRPGEATRVVWGGSQAGFVADNNDAGRAAA